MMRGPNGELAMLFVGALVLALMLWVAWSSLEARAFNNATGKNVSTLDAMFISLRVQESAK